ncbi:4-aminobutyrate aminotransferase [Robiginitalea myxolifaciens]|uniref:4-aminobutyrate aminotransferase n=1 Tax=Robiginitalea myxolifaciens TaxID=400055 RepID=A0A1I6GZT2_9FLAO|nr:aminotransferase class III-fold pyridoxal phosphate-dependent enzyme [Robiginitalea myxolifaciens]SFR47682.1 4-aminobutyrate aminotransferase [Robiginitalea myxolifaciens]
MIIEQLLREKYGIHPLEIKRQAGYQNGTFKVRLKDGLRIAKTYRKAPWVKDLLEVESQMLRRLSQTLPTRFPVIIPDLQENTLLDLGEQYFRLLSFVPGTFLAETDHSPELQASFGAFLGELTAQLADLPPGNIGALERSWDLQHLEKVQALVPAVAAPEDRRVISYFLHQFQQEVLPRRYALRKSVIHNDSNDWNVLCNGHEVSGLIDFGDLCYSWTINEVAVGLTYLLMDKENPLEVAANALKAFHQQFPLLGQEMDLLYYLIAGRLCMSLCHSASKADSSEDPEYIRISEAGARKLLHRWISITPERAADVFREAIGLHAQKVISAGEYQERRSRVLGKSLSLSYQQPIGMRRAAMQYMFDAAGNTFLDAYNNIMLVGHCHPHVTEAAARTSRRLNTNTRYYYDEILDYAEHLLSWFPDHLSQVYFVNSGSAATDLAIRMSRAHTGKNKMLCLDRGYHGNTQSGIEISPYKHHKDQEYPNAVVGPFPKKPANRDWDSWYGDLLENYRNLIQRNQNDLSGLIAEPIMGCGGQLPLPEGLLKALYTEIRNFGGVCISDEVQVGFGRLGQWKWGFEMHQVLPDMVVLGKPMGNGHPIGAVVTTREISESFAQGPEFFSSFGGNPVSCAIGKAVLEVVEAEGLQQQAANVGAYLIHEFEGLAANYSWIKEVRGSGLFLGIECLAGPKQNATELAAYLCNELRNAHILTGLDGPGNTVLKIKPPLVFNRANADQLVEETNNVMRKINQF